MIVVQIAGRLGKDAESRFTPAGQKVTTLTMATTVRKAGKEETVWWRVTIWGERYDKMAPYFKKGSALIVIGEMSKPEIWTDKEGRPQVSLDMTADIVRFNPFGGSSDRSQENGTSNQSNQSSQGSYGIDSGDFGGSTQNGSSRYSQSNQAEEPLPF